ncbi:MAG: glycosyltransferase family 9 protein [Deltaproteobacteria bacterium]|nr:glycosyltransferase family 9 protein [Deltaproteobacteria bacterium]
MIGRSGTTDLHVEENKVLVLSRGALGDVLLTLPLLARLPSHFQADSLTLAGNYSILRLLADLPFISEIMDHDRAEWAGLYRNPPDVGERLTKKIQSHKAAIVMAKGDSDQAVSGLKQLGLPIVLSVPSRPPFGVKVHLTNHLLAALDPGLTPEPILIRPRPEAVTEAKKILTAFEPDRSPWLALHPGSGGEKKNWPLSQWIELAGKLSESGLRNLFILGPAEKGYDAIIRRELKPEKAFLAQDLPLPVLAALLTLSHGYIGQDSGVSHLSGVLGVPTLAIFGPTDPACWAPLGPKVRIIAPSGTPRPTDPWTWLKTRQVIQAAKEFF